MLTRITDVYKRQAQVGAANAVWPAKQEKILPEYAQTVRDYYNCLLYTSSGLFFDFTIKVAAGVMVNQRPEKINSPTPS